MSGGIQLSSGCIEAIMNGDHYDKPVLQILSAKKIAGAEGAERYRLLVSDGKYLNSYAMLGTQLNEQYAQGNFIDYTVVRVDRYITSTVNKGDNKRVLIFLELTVLNHGSEVGKKIGNPVQYNPDSSKSGNTMPTSTSTNQSSSNFGTSGNSGISNGSLSNRTTKPSTSVSKISHQTSNLSMNNNDDISQSLTHPIASLSPYQNKWVIKARVVSKSPIRTWSNPKGEGKLFSMDLVDDSGEIRATAFRDACDKYYNYIEVDKVYYISKCVLKSANKQYSTLNNDYEMTFTNDTIVQLCEDDESSIPQIQYNFLPISQIQNIEPESSIDIIGVCKEVSELQVFMGKNKNREFKKRSLTLVDTSNSSVELTIWGDEAVNFDGYVQPVILVKGAQVKEFGGGKTLTLRVSSVMKVNPDIPEGHRLRGWFDNGGAENITNCISTRNPGSTGSMTTEWLTFHEARMRNLGSGDKPDYFQTKALVHIIKSTNSIYKACPQQDCNKKVIDEENGNYRCEKCNAVYQNFKYRMLINMSIGDWTSNRWVTCFSDIAEQLLGKTAEEIGNSIENNPETAEEIFSSINFKDFVFKLRTKIEMFGDSPRNRLTVMNATPINYKEYNKYLIQNLQEITGVGKL